MSAGMFRDGGHDGAPRRTSRSAYIWFNITCVLRNRQSSVLYHKSLPEEHAHDILITDVRRENLATGQDLEGQQSHRPHVSSLRDLDITLLNHTDDLSLST